MQETTAKYVNPVVDSVEQLCQSSVQRLAYMYGIEIEHELDSLIYCLTVIKNNCIINHK